jgi:hypothetical protein
MMGDAHEFVVDDDGEVVGGESVALADDEVVEFFGADGDIAQDLVVDGDGLLGHLEADDMALAGIHAAYALGMGDLQGGAVVLVAGLGGDGLLAFGLEFLGGLEGGVGQAGVDEGAEVGVVEVDAVGLVVGADAAGVAAEGAAIGGGEGGALVPVDAEPGEGAEDALGGGVGGAALVGVLDAEQELSAVAAGEGPVEQGGAGAADVEASGGGGGEAGDDGGRRVGCGHGKQA